MRSGARRVELLLLLLLLRVVRLLFLLLLQLLLHNRLLRRLHSRRLEHGRGRAWAWPGGGRLLRELWLGRARALDGLEAGARLERSLGALDAAGGVRQDGGAGAQRQDGD